MFDGEEMLMQSMGEYNQILVSKLKQVENEIAKLLSQTKNKDAPFDFDGPNYDDEYCEIDHPNNESPQSVNDLERNLSATEELTGIKFENFKRRNISSQDGLPPGMWREVIMDLKLDELNVTIAFIENAECNTGPVLSLKWSVNEEFAAAELAPLSTIIKDDLPSLIIRFREYAQLNRDRMNILDEFSHHFKEFVNIKPMENGICIMWNGTFKMLWSLIPCENIGKIINTFQIDIYDKDIFLESQAILEEFCNLDKSTRSPQNALMRLGALAKQIYSP